LTIRWAFAKTSG